MHDLANVRADRCAGLPGVARDGWRGRHAAFAGVAVALICATLLVPEPLTRHMLLHLALMNVVAPWLAGSLDRRAAVEGELVAATLLQTALLWAWHAPPVLIATLSSPVLHLLMLASLTLAAIAFWSAVFATRAGRRWQSIVALLITGKLVCLLGALLVFAPRPIFNCERSPMCGAGAVDSPLADQHLAGLLMIAACPLTYVTAGVVIAARWLRDMRVAAWIAPVQQET